MIVTKYKGGGGSTTTASTIPEWMKPYLERNIQRAENAYESGSLSNVAKFNPLQESAQEAALFAADQQGAAAQYSAGGLDTLSRISAGEEVVPATTGATDAIKAAAARSASKLAQPGIAQSAARGTVGGSRNLIQAGEGEAELAAKMAGIDYNDLQQRRQAAQSAASSTIQGASAVQDQLMAGVNTQRGVGADIQKQTQMEADATNKGIASLSGALHGTPWQSQQNIQSGGK